MAVVLVGLRRLTGLLVVLAGLCWVAAPVIYALRLNAPSSYLLDTTVHDAQIYIMADKTVLAQKWDCITLTWRLQNISSVYLAGMGTVGEDSQQLCNLHSPLTMTVHFHDGASQDFLIEFDFLLPFGQPAQLVVLGVCWLIAAVGVRYGYLMVQYVAKVYLTPQPSVRHDLTPQPSVRHDLTPQPPLLKERGSQIPLLVKRGGARGGDAPMQGGSKTIVTLLLLLVLLQAGWRLWHFPHLPLTCCDHTLIPGRALELAQFPVFSVTEFRYSAVGQAFLSRYGIGIYLVPYFTYEFLQTLGIPLTNFALHLPAFLYGIIKLPLVFALAYQLTERKGVALLATALVGVYWEAVVINSTYYGAFPHIIGEMVMLLFAVRWLKYGRFADMLLTVLGMVLVIALHSLFIVSLGLLVVLHIFPPPGVPRRVPWHFFWQARELLPIPILLLVVHALTDIATLMDLGRNNGEGIFLRFFSHTGDGWHPELLFGSGVQYYAWVGWLAFVIALVFLIVNTRKTKQSPFMLAWVAPYLCLYLVNSGLYIIFITPVVGIITAYGLSLIADKLNIKLTLRGIASSGLILGIFAHSVSFVDMPIWWAQCYKPIAIILEKHYPGRTVSSAIAMPAFYYDAYPQTIEFDANNLILIVDERFQYPADSENSKALNRNAAFLAQLAETPLPVLATLNDESGLPVCHLMGANADAIGDVSIAALSHEFDSKHTKMLDFVAPTQD
jgi:hypothetical protein